VKAVRSSCSLPALFGGVPFLSIFFFAAWVCACADVHAAGGHAKSSMQRSPAANPQPMRSVGKGLLIPSRRPAFVRYLRDCALAKTRRHALALRMRRAAVDSSALIE